MMASLIRKFVLFFSGLALFMVAASVYFELRVRRTDDFYRQVAEFRNPDVQPSVLLVGDSRMAINVDPSRLPASVYNFSYPGESMRHLYLRVKFALETKPSIKHLVLGLEDVLFSDARAQLRDAVPQMAFSDLVDLAEVYPSSARFLLRHAVLHYLPLVNADQRRRTFDTLINDLRALITGRPAASAVEYSCGGLRFVREGQWSKLDKEQRHALAWNTVERLFDGSTYSPEMRAVLMRILDLANRHGVRVIGLRNPVSGSYAHAASRYSADPRHAFFDPKDLYAVLDYETALVTRPRDFQDADHLNARGSARFTERLLADLRKLAPIVDGGPRRCDSSRKPAVPTWPYHDVLSEWLKTPSCHNLRGTCGSAGPIESQLYEANRPLDGGELQDVKQRSGEADAAHGTGAKEGA
ncbi:MAG: hypothetical protein RBS99_01625 [Rhodospirillales bacterium]|jgi:hypothetical protein|nr:hypothetical protein [Rhodospirillales bacterium]